MLFAACPLPRAKTLKYAKCFICSKSGHISKDCPENANGLYPKGGCCHICLQKTHLVRDCPERTEEDAEQHRKRKLLDEDNKLGPRIGEVTADVEGIGGDYDSLIVTSTQGGNDEESEYNGGEGAGSSRNTGKVVWHPGMKRKKLKK